MAFENSVVPEDWRSAVIVSLYKGKVERTKCRHYRDISLFSVAGKNICHYVPRLGVCSLSVLWSYLIYGNEKSRITAVQVDNLRQLLGIKRMNKIPK